MVLHSDCHLRKKTLTKSLHLVTSAKWEVLGSAVPYERSESSPRVSRLSETLWSHRGGSRMQAERE